MLTAKKSSKLWPRMGPQQSTQSQSSNSSKVKTAPHVYSFEHTNPTQGYLAETEGVRTCTSERTFILYKM